MAYRRTTLADLAAGRSRISDILMQGGQAQAEAALRGGEGWGNAFASIGQQLGGAVQAYGAQNDEKRIQEAVMASRGMGAPSKPAMDMSVTGDPRATSTAAAPDINAILGKLPPELRGRAMKGIQDSQQTAAAFEKNRLELEDLKGKITERERGAQEALATHWGTGAFNLKGHLADEDGGIGAANYFVAFSGAQKMPGTERLAPMAQQAAEALDQAKASGDPTQVKAVVDAWRKQAAPVYEQGLAALPPDKLKTLMEATQGEGINLPEGGTLVNKRTGAVMATGAPKQDTRSLDVRLANAQPGSPEYQQLLKAARDEATAKRDPLAGQKEKFWVMRDGKPLRVSESEYLPGDKPANTREQGRPVTSGDAGKFTDLDTSLDDINTLTQTIVGNKATGTSAKIGASLWNPITDITGWGAEAKQKQATIDRVKQVIGKALEGGVLRKEDEAKYEKILPTIGDTQDVVASKLDGLWKAIEKKRQTHMDSLQDAGYDVTKYQARAPRGRSAPSGVPVPAPDVKKKVNPFRK